MAMTSEQMITGLANMKKMVKKDHDTILHHSRILAGLEHNIESGDFDEGQKKAMEKQAKTEKALIAKYRKKMETDLRKEKQFEARVRKEGALHRKRTSHDG